MPAWPGVLDQEDGGRFAAADGGRIQSHGRPADKSGIYLSTFMAAQVQSSDDKRFRYLPLSYIHRPTTHPLHSSGDFSVCQSVPEPIVEIVDSQTDAAVSSDRVLYYRIGSSLELRCRVRHYWIKPKIFQWLKSGTPVADELWRGGISIYTEITKPGQLENKLSIANATINDGGNYTCSLDSFSFSIVVHFLKEEKQAASQHATNGGRLSLALHSLNQELVRHLLLSFLVQIVIVHQHHHLFRVVR
ncbi:uncharacterized protein LOC124195754 isoform X5 [Daphnia pulex]|uniref:uncharacterized protein LOC124195754 isoform X5 n=1 Tax=Daphnia pulex TaxID=6669 RepID=UPI001EDE9CB1|nr:uncharacterized protein LOC124195754 isoform X5 [Daphnia pulex]